MFACWILLSFISLTRTASKPDDICRDSFDPLVRCTTEGLIRGKRIEFFLNRSHPNENKYFIDTFLGIPYAEPPIGDQRFRKSNKITPRDRSIVYDATKFGYTCYQMIIDFLNATGEKVWAPNTPMSEDCLFLNIWAPSNARNQQQRLPVMVWIYGGGFTSGSSTLKVYDGSILSATQNVIVVSIEYRVESLGFLYLGTPEAPGNQGLYDQQLALQWIQNNIHWYGGDSQRVTLFGESAGAVSVGLHLLLPKSRPLFQNAILQSSGPTAKWAVLTPSIAKFRSEKFLNALTRYISERLQENDQSVPIPVQCRRTFSSIEEKFQCVKYYPIRGIEHFRSLWAMESYNGDPIGYTFVPTIDADLIPYDPELMLLNGDFKRTTILLGVNQDEVPSVDSNTFRTVLAEYFRHVPTYPIQQNKVVLESILQLYTLWNDLNNTVQNAIQLNYAVGDYHLTCPTIFLADIYAKDKLPVYFYYFTIRSSVSPWHPWMGVLHADEIMFIFGEPLNNTDDLHYNRDEIIISEKIMAYWANFAKYGNPNQLNDHQWANEWQKYTWPERQHVVLNMSLANNVIPEHGSAFRANYCSFWIDFLPKLIVATANISEEERRWREEFHDYSARIKEWDYHYVKYVQLIEKSKELSFIPCGG